MCVLLFVSACVSVSVSVFFSGKHKIYKQGRIKKIKGLTNESSNKI